MEPIPVLKDKRVILGVTGGIAAYKVASLASHLTQAGALVDVVMTPAATRFVSPLTFQTLTGRATYSDMWDRSGEGLSIHIAHVGLAHAADLFVVAPATANTVAKLATGIADNLLTTLALAARCPILVAPAMDVGMWAHPATQANAAKLRTEGVHMAGPASGRMASGLEGEGRMVEPDELLGHIRWVLGQAGGLAGRRVVVTAGPTREPIDPVRFISNPSSGRQGFALAQAALDRGAGVTLITGPSDLSTPVGAQRVDVVTVQDMLEAVLLAVAQADVLLMAAAPADYAPAVTAAQKIKKGAADLTLHLARTADVLSAIATGRAEAGSPRVVVGFAAESEDLVRNAEAKLATKRLDLIVANDVTASDAGFAVETNRVVLLDRCGGVEELPVMAKAAVAEIILDRVVGLLVDEG
jgi:phosphopantothenoylcysteine decarboxylase/phosphopantothenate--cysteine ligase